MDQRIPGPFESFSSGKVATSMPRPLQRFYKGEPLALGYIISGSLSVVAAKNPKMPLMKGMLAMNILSAVVAGIVTGISTTSIMFVGSRGRGYACARSSNNTKAIQSCRILVTIPYSTMYSTVAFLLMLTVLEFLIAIVSSAFGCASLCRDSYSETTIVIFQNAAEASPPPPPPAP